MIVEILKIVGGVFGVSFTALIVFNLLLAYNTKLSEKEEVKEKYHH